MANEINRDTRYTPHVSYTCRALHKIFIDYEGQSALIRGLQDQISQLKLAVLSPVEFERLDSLTNLLNKAEKVRV